MSIHIENVFHGRQNHPIANERRNKKMAIKVRRGMASTISFDYVICVPYVTIMSCCPHTERSIGSIN